MHARTRTYVRTCVDQLCSAFTLHGRFQPRSSHRNICIEQFRDRESRVDRVDTSMAREVGPIGSDRTSRRRPTGPFRNERDVSRGTPRNGTRMTTYCIHGWFGTAPWRAIARHASGRRSMRQRAPVPNETTALLLCRQQCATLGAPQTPAGSHYCVHNRELFVIGNHPSAPRGR
jgi:hypothetical protein